MIESVLFGGVCFFGLDLTRRREGAKEEVSFGFGLGLTRGREFFLVVVSFLGCVSREGAIQERSFMDGRLPICETILDF